MGKITWLAGHTSKWSYPWSPNLVRRFFGPVWIPQGNKLESNKSSSANARFRYLLLRVLLIWWTFREFTLPCRVYVLELAPRWGTRDVARQCTARMSESCFEVDMSNYLHLTWLVCHWFLQSFPLLWLSRLFFRAFWSILVQSHGWCMLPTIYCAQRKCEKQQKLMFLVRWSTYNLCQLSCSYCLQVSHERQVQHFRNIEKLALPWTSMRLLLPHGQALSCSPCSSLLSSMASWCPSWLSSLQLQSLGNLLQRCWDSAWPATQTTT